MYCPQMLKDKFAQKYKIQSLATHPHANEKLGQVLRFCISGASQQESVAAFSETTEVDGDVKSKT